MKTPTAQAKMATGLVYQNGDQVKSFIRRMILIIEKAMCALETGIDNKQVFVRNGDIHSSRYICNLQLVNDPVKVHKGETVDKNSIILKEIKM